MIHILLTVLDLGGTFVFAISGAAAAVKHRLDIFGVMVLAFAAGNAGGITRDVLIGAVPPAAIANWSYVGISILAGFAVFFWYPVIARLNNPVLWFDAVGLAFFAVAGAQKALVHGLNPAMAALLGMLTGIGGGMLRDILINDIPVVMRADLYALAALAAAIVVAIGHVLHISPIATTIIGGLLCFALRYMAIRHGKGYLLQRHQNDSSFSPIIISQLEFPLSELRIPPDAVEEFVDGSHFDGGLPTRVLLSMPILGSSTQVLWQSGHFEGLVNFSPENSKPHARQRAGSITALYSVCLRLRNK